MSHVSKHTQCGGSLLHFSYFITKSFQHSTVAGRPYFSDFLFYHYKKVLYPASFFIQLVHIISLNVLRCFFGSHYQYQYGSTFHSISVSFPP